MEDIRTASIRIRRPARQVYDYMNDPQNFPRWSLFITGIRRVGNEWEATSQAGTSRMRFEPTNALGVLDHWVKVSPEQTIYVPLRVLADGEGCAVVFTIFRLPEMDDAAFAADVAMVEKDLAHLKHVLEH